MLVWLENAYSRPFWGSFWGTFPPNDVTNRHNPKKDHPWAEPRHLSHKPRKSVARFELGVWTKKKDRTRQDRTVQDRTGKKSQKGYISPICGEAPTEAMYMKICVVGDVLDVITYAKFQNEVFRGYNFTGGRIFHFSYWFWMGLTTVQRYCAACDGKLMIILHVPFLTSNPFSIIHVVDNRTKMTIHCRRCDEKRQQSLEFVTRFVIRFTLGVLRFTWTLFFKSP